MKTQNKFDNGGLATYVIGAGNVGLGLAMALEKRGLPITGIWNRSPERASAAARWVCCPVDTGALNPRNAHLLIVAVADHAIAQVGQLLAAAALPKACVVAHTSGCLPAAALGTLPGASLGSVHPLLACPTAAQAAVDLLQAPYVIEGDKAAILVLEGWVACLGARSQRIQSAAKARYHAAAVMASNLVLALLRAAASEAQAAGVNNLGPALNRLALGAVQQACDRGLAEALTGPVLRGDSDTVARHLGALQARHAEVYKALSQEALCLAVERGLPEARVDALVALLGAPKISE